VAKKKKNIEGTTLEEIKKKLAERYGTNVRKYERGAATPTYKTGSIKLDQGLGGGLARGRLTEIIGENTSGKTTLALSVCAEAQKAQPEMSVLYVDKEHTLDTQWAEKIGIDWSRFEHGEPTRAEEALTMMEAFMQTGQCSVIVLDSIAAMLTEAEAENAIGEANIGSQARLLAVGLKRIVQMLPQHPETTLIFVNQMRARIGGGPTSFNFEPTKTTGGKAPPYYMTTRLMLTRVETLNEGEGDKQHQVGQVVLVRILKNKINNGPGMRVKFAIDQVCGGIDKAKEVLDLAIEKELIQKSASWYVFSEDIKEQGAKAAKEIIRKDLDQWIEQVS
jgi:recombination protein RecA